MSNAKHEYREAALEEYGEECQSCDSTNNIEVHHIDGDRSNNNLENLMPLCRTCHRSIHSSKDLPEILDGLRDELPEEKVYTEESTHVMKVSGNVMGQIAEIKEEHEHTSYDSAIRELLHVYQTVTGEDDYRDRWRPWRK